MPECFDDLPVLAGLGSSLRAAMATAEAAEFAATPAPSHVAAERSDQHQRRWRRATSGRFGALSTVLVLGLVGTAAAAATLTILRGSPIPAPRAADLQPVMTARAETQRVLALRADDPDAGPGAAVPYALRTGESEGGLTCVTVGQISDGRFGIVGTDSRFRELPPTLIDGCGKLTDEDAAVAGARVLDADRYGDVRTVVYGVGGPALQSAAVDVRGERRSIPVRDGAFVAVLRGYPEDQGLTLHLGLAGGRAVTHDLGVGPMTVVDPSGPAWILESGTTSGSQTSCVTLRRARWSRSSPSTASVCDSTPGPKSGIPEHAVSFDVRTFRPGNHGLVSRRYGGEWRWHDAPARTVVWGHADPKRVRLVTARAADGATAEVKPTVNGAFAIVFPGDVPAPDMRMTFEFKDGSRRAYDRPVLPVGRVSG